MIVCADEVGSTFWDSWKARRYNLVDSLRYGISRTYVRYVRSIEFMYRSNSAVDWKISDITQIPLNGIHSSRYYREICGETYLCAVRNHRNVMTLIATLVVIKRSSQLISLLMEAVISR